MHILPKMMFILIGDDRTGKTTLQKLLIRKLHGADYIDGKLKTNLSFNIHHPEIKRKYKTVSFANRSYQEKIGDYESIENYFAKFFTDADIAFISSHLVHDDIEEMIRRGKNRFFNVYGVFFTNSIRPENANSQISELNWDERFVIENPWSDNDENTNLQLDRIAENFVDLIVNRTSIS